MATPEDSLWLNKTVTVVAAQISPGPDEAENLRMIEKCVAEAARRRASLVVFPEYASYFNGRLGADFVAHAQPLDGPFVCQLAEIAAVHGIHVVAGFGEVDDRDDQRLWNTVVAVSPKGEIEGIYRKVHLFDTFGHHESRYVRPGPLDDPQTFEVEGIVVGLQAGYDLRFPEITRRIVDAGAELVAVPSQWVGGSLKELHWRTLVQARAIENTVYVLAAGQSVPDGIGRSLIVDPMGVVLSATGAEDALVHTEISLQRIAQVRATNPALQGRRFAVTVADEPQQR
ncbi:carbon-nitrogen hydrolase family protein [Pseudoclavibacter sp. 13-3]|uniref:carbon-nitrogen hydrolase family protein n=1 Tax=Pseudoclavibacter sp. 13-3 TaxID=2901228 RepID=UPI001E5C9096|nr:carbon-nitrogen hydrolase family protein [Pseudoclavibacter sp. 13-3]MCD7102079.1 carbon-nitrogen hydrolase family protein [Pseudoclavibacter sp. 13-3]